MGARVPSLPKFYSPLAFLLAHISIPWNYPIFLSRILVIPIANVGKFLSAQLVVSKSTKGMICKLSRILNCKARQPSTGELGSISLFEQS